jgi:hypothetical protein
MSKQLIAEYEGKISFIVAEIEKLDELNEARKERIETLKNGSPEEIEQLEALVVRFGYETKMHTSVRELNLLYIFRQGQKSLQKQPRLLYLREYKMEE